MTDRRNQIQDAYNMVDRRQNDAALKAIEEILAGLTPPNRATTCRPPHHFRPSANGQTRSGRGARNRASQGRPEERPARWCVENSWGGRPPGRP